jgi:hypothetical protein
MLVWAMRLRSLVFRGPRGAISRAAARWAASGNVAGLVDTTDGRSDVISPS